MKYFHFVYRKNLPKIYDLKKSLVDSTYKGQKTFGSSKTNQYNILNPKNSIRDISSNSIRTERINNTLTQRVYNNNIFKSNKTINEISYLTKSTNIYDNKKMHSSKGKKGEKYFSTDEKNKAPEQFLRVSKKPKSKILLRKGNKNNLNFFQTKYLTLNNFKKKYPLMIDPKPIRPQIFTNLPLNLRQLNKQNMLLLRNETNKAFTQYFKENKFSKKFQNIFNTMDNTEICKHNETKKNLDNLIINNDIISGNFILKEVSQKEEKHNIIEKNTKGKKYIYDKIKKSIISLYLKFINMNVPLDEILKNYVTPKNSFYFGFTKDLFFAIKTKNILLFNSIINSNKFLVLDFDYYQMTALHFAAKYNFYKIIPKLIEYGSSIDKKNYINDTPLLISVKHKYLESTVILLFYLASPFEKDFDGLNSFDHSKNDDKLEYIFKGIDKIYIVSLFKSSFEKYEFLQKEIANYFINEYKNDLEPDALEILKAKMEYYENKNKYHKNKNF